MRDFHELSNHEGDICGVHAEQPSTIVLRHSAYQGLDSVLRNLCHPYIFQVKDASPRLYLARNHGMLDNVL